MMIQDNTNNDDSKPNPPTLPIELIFEILQLLPVRSLLRCESVCKVWLSLISSPDFVKTHLLKSLENTQFANRRLISTTYEPYNRMEDCSVCYLLNEHEPFCETPRVECPTNDPSKYIKIVGTCNGLICLAIDNHPLNGPLFLWNPTTRKSKELPISEKIMNYKTYETEYGFGYDECSDDYKVVATFSSVKEDVFTEDVEEENDAKKIEVEIYSLRLDCWRSIEDLPCRWTCGGLLNEPVKYANGALHWVDIPEYGEDARVIVSLDLKTEKYGEVAQPKYREGDQYYLILGDSEKSLCILCSYDQNFETDVWVMNEYGVKESWMILARIPRIGDPLPNWYAVPRSVSANGDIVVDSDYGLVVYNYKDCTLKDIDSSKFSGYGTTRSYIESLVSPNV